MGNNTCKDCGRPFDKEKKYCEYWKTKKNEKRKKGEKGKRRLAVGAFISKKISDNKDKIKNIAKKILKG